MKKSELRQIIREEIVLLIEQPRDNFALNKKKFSKQYELWKNLLKIKKFPKDMSIKKIVDKYEKKLKDLGFKTSKKDEHRGTYTLISAKKSRTVKIQFDEFTDNTWQATLLSKKGIVGQIKINK